MIAAMRLTHALRPPHGAPLLHYLTLLGWTQHAAVLLTLANQPCHDLRYPS
jgi:hypothetical protein